MSKNIEINYKNSSGYEVLYPKTKTDVNYLSSAVNTLFGFTKENSLDDALAQLFLGVGKYGYAIHVEYPDGSPAEGFTVTGIEAIEGRDLVTDADGNTIGTSLEANVTIEVISPFIDIDDVKNITIQSQGILTPYSINVEPAAIRFASESKKYFLSPIMKTVDLCAVGGGGGGFAVTGSRDYGAGGGGGYATNLLGVSISNDREIIIEVGAGSKRVLGASPQTFGGTTNIKKSDGTLLLSANGGGSGYFNNGNVQPGTGNGDGSSYVFVSNNLSHYDPTLYSGGSSSVFLFEDEQLGLAGGGGGGGCTMYWGDTGRISKPPRGAPNGGIGAYRANSSSEVFAGENGIVPGGGGGSGYASVAPGDGGGGRVYIRGHY